MNLLTALAWLSLLVSVCLPRIAEATSLALVPAYGYGLAFRGGVVPWLAEHGGALLVGTLVVSPFLLCLARLTVPQRPVRRLAPGAA